MAEIELKSIFKTQLATSVAESFYLNPKVKSYIFVGKVDSWVENQNDSIPSVPIPEVTDTLQEELDAWKNMLACAPVERKNVSLVVKRNNWKFGEYYDQYSHDDEIFNMRKFYVITPSNHVYKCLSNNGGSVSEFEPYGTSVEELILPDGYIWKYLYTVREELYRFLTPEYMPVENLELLSYNDDRQNQLNVQLTAIDGSIENIELVSTGSPYPFTIDEETDENNSENYITEIETLSDGSFRFYLNNVDLLSVMDNFYNGYVLYISSGFLAGKVFDIEEYSYNDGSPIITLNSDQITSTTFTFNNRPFFKILPKVTIFGNGTNASAIARINKTTKQISSFEILNPGANYRYATVEVVLYDLITNAEKVETIGKVIISPYGGHGKNAIFDLLPRHVMVSVNLREAEIEDIVNENEFRQFGILQNPVLNDGTERLAGTEIPDQIMLRLKNKNATVSITFSDTTEEIQDILTSTEIAGELIEQGLETSPNRAIGRIISYTPTSYKSGILLANLLNGSFSTNLLANPITVEEKYTIDESNTISLITNDNFYTSSTFEEGKKILAYTTNSTAEIQKSVITNNSGTACKVYLKNIKGNFQESYYNSVGELINGELVVSYDYIDSNTGQLVSANDILESVSYVVDSEKQNYEASVNNYRTTTLLTINWNNYTNLINYEKDAVVYQDLNDGTKAMGTVVSWTVTDENNKLGRLEITNVTGQFTTSSEDLAIKTVNDTNTDISELVSIIEPELIPFSGKITYIQNVRPVLKTSDQDEEIKILIGF
jgi:hypothetical protein